MLYGLRILTRSLCLMVAIVRYVFAFPIWVVDDLLERLGVELDGDGDFYAEILAGVWTVCFLIWLGWMLWK